MPRRTHTPASQQGKYFGRVNCLSRMPEKGQVKPRKIGQGHMEWLEQMCTGERVVNAFGKQNNLLRVKRENNGTLPGNMADW